MKKLYPIIGLLVVCAALIPAAHAVTLETNINATVTVNSDDTSGQFTAAALIVGRCDFSISGTWSGTVTLQRSFDGGTTWMDVAEYTSNLETVIDEPAVSGLYYRVGMKSGAWTSGVMTARLYQ